MKEWFSKGCQSLSAAWEENEITGDPHYKEARPALTFCTHIDNIDNCEGNCNPASCPIKKQKLDPNGVE